MEPTTASASAAYALSKLWLAAGASVGSAATGALWQPAALAEYGKLMKGVIIGGIGVGTPVVAGGFLLTWLGLDPHSADVAMFVGLCMSIVSLLFFVTVTNYFKKKEHLDIFEVVKDTKQQIQQPTVAAKPKRPRAHRKVASK